MIEQVKRDNSITTEAQLQQQLRQMGMTMASYRQEVKKTLLRYRVVNIAVGSKVTVSDGDVQNYYDRHMKSGGAKTVPCFQSTRVKSASPSYQSSE